MGDTSTLKLVDEKKNLIKKINDRNHTIYKDFTLETQTEKINIP